MRLKLRIIVLCEIQFLPNEKFYLFIYLFIYLCIYLYFLPFFAKFDNAKLKEFGDLQNQILAILKTFSTHKGIHT